MLKIVRGEGIHRAYSQNYRRKWERVRTGTGNATDVCKCSTEDPATVDDTTSSQLSPLSGNYLSAHLLTHSHTATTLGETV